MSRAAWTPVGNIPRRDEHSSRCDSALSPRITGTPNGDFVVVWKEYVETANVAGDVVRARRLGRTGTPQGPEFAVSPLY